MKSLKFWQYCFLTGFGAFVLSFLIIYGPSGFLAIAGALAIVFGVINSLLSKPAERTNNPLTSAFKRILNVNPFLISATILLWLATATISTYGGVSWYSEYRERQKVTIEGTVVTAGGDLADKATVTLFLKRHNLETWTIGGKFIFSKVDFRDEDMTHVRIHARLGSREGDAEVDLSQVNSSDVIVKLSPGDPPFRVTYLLLERQAIDFFLQGKMDRRWEEKLAGQPYIVPNNVYQSLGRLVKNFSESYRESQPIFAFYKEANGVKSDPQEVATDQPAIASYFVGGSKGDVVFLSDNVAQNLLDTIVDKSSDWKVFIDPARNQSMPYPLAFRRYINRGDFDRFAHEPIARFYSFITKDYLPPDFGYLQLRWFGICSDDPPWYAAARYVGRIVRLRIAVIENISDAPIKLGNFAFTEDDTENIHSRDAAKSQLEKSELRHEKLFPMEMLKSGEKLAIPIEMQLAKNAEATDDFETAASRPDVYNSVRTRGQLYFPGPQSGESSHGVSIPATELENMLGRSNQMVNLDREYLLGPSVDIKTLEADKVEFPFRQFDASRLVVWDQDASGSCPYVYTFSSEANAWHNEGVILRGKVGHQRESLAEKELDQFDGRILLKEKDSEDSFIDSIFVRAVYADGHEVVVYPTNAALHSVDGKRLRLRQGEEVSLSFKVPNPKDVRKFFVGAVGYYVPYKGSNYLQQSRN
jgi:hypothetical protein